MRTRLLMVLVVFALAAVAAFAVPLLNATAAQRTQQLVISRTADLDWFAALAGRAIDSGDVAALTAAARHYSQMFDEGVVVVDAHRTPLVQTGGLTAADVRGPIEAALRNEPMPPPETVMPWSNRPLLFARAVGTATLVSGVVVLRTSVGQAATDIAERWELIGAGALLAGLVFVLLAMVLARWVLRPLNALAYGVRAVTAGRRAQVPAMTGPHELRSLASAFNKMSDAVLAAAAQQRRLIADTSHQLRNPMAALRLRVDSLAPHIDDGGKRSYRGAVAEMERLERLLEGLLALAVADSTATRMAVGDDDGEACDVVAVLSERLDAWGAAGERSGVRLGGVAYNGAPVLVRCPEFELAQVLDVLLDNAVRYAGEGACVRVSWSVSGDRVVLVVADNGPGLPDEELALATQRFWRAGRPGAPRGTGLGLAIAARQVAARGGRLQLRPARPHGLQVTIALPRASEVGP